MAQTNNETQQENNLPVEEKNGVDKEVKEDNKPVESIEKVLENVEKTENENINSENIQSSEVSIELLEKIRKQVEFYFGDVNMQRDRFLTEQTKLDDGWIPMTVMLNFKILASLSKDIETILKALENSELIEISEDKKKIRRSLDKPLPTYDETYKKAQESRTIYLKGFPTDSTMDSLKSYLDSTMDVVESIIMRKYKKGKEYFFKGSIFLQFKTVEDAKTFIEQESIKYNETELIKMWAVDYAALKEKEREERRQKKLKNQSNQANNKTSSNEKNNTQNKFKLPKGCIIYFSNVKSGIKREEIKEKLIELDSEVAYIDYNNGDIEGWIRLQGENSAVDLLKKLESNTINVEGCDIVCKLLEGEEEEAYLVKIQESMTSRRLNRRGHHRKGFKRGHSPHRDGNAKKPNLDD